MKTLRKKNKNKVNNIFAIIAVVIVIIAVFNLIIMFIKINEFNKQLTGYATTVSGYVNITINTVLSVDVTPTSINWGSGLVNNGSAIATLTTRGNSSTVSNGSWANSTITGFVVKNTGNINGTLNMTHTKNATELFGPNSNSARAYSLNISLKDSNSCTGGVQKAAFLTANKTNTSLPWTLCSQFGNLDESNDIWVDVQLVVPNDFNATSPSDILTFTIY